ncbi:hypothetical protein [Streptomyces sp. NPDC053726]|uniref:hypothetical protein n=1 Tax=Streptomyces sp. NPDC053726 TaxID=3365713 RepID=UPI0037D6A5EA
MPRPHLVGAIVSCERESLGWPGPARPVPRGAHVWRAVVLLFSWLGFGVQSAPVSGSMSQQQCVMMPLDSVFIGGPPAMPA